MMAFVSFKQKFGKTYNSPKEFAFRFAKFLSTFRKIEATNALGLSHTSALNQFSDLTKEEFKAKYLGYKPNTNEVLTYNNELLNAIPSNDVDWRSTTGVVTPIKDQGQCGSCWAFSATGSLEGTAALGAKQPSLSFSEQQLVDCSTKYGNEGCNGGLMNQAFQYVIEHGIETEAQYPYKARDQICKSKTGAFKVGHFANVPVKSSGALAAACNIQPVSVAIEADEIMSYSGGIFADKNCGSQLDHGVLLVGYTADYWIVKNSWGSTWGEQGYIRMSRTAIPDTKGGICGILTAASYPTL
jgi:C1A family cysteine protease